MSNILGQNLKARRKFLKISQQELAEAVGYTSRSTIAKIESGSIDLPQSKIYDIANALETSPAYLLGLEDEVKQMRIDELLKQIEAYSVDEFVDGMSQLDTTTFEKLSEAFGRLLPTIE